MNDPERRFEDHRHGQAQRRSTAARPCQVPVKVDFSFADPPADNTARPIRFSTPTPSAWGKRPMPGSTGPRSAPPPAPAPTCTEAHRHGADRHRRGRQAGAGPRPSSNPLVSAATCSRQKAAVRIRAPRCWPHQNADAHTVWRFIGFKNIWMAGSHVSTNGSRPPSRRCTTLASCRLHRRCATPIPAAKGVRVHRAVGAAPPRRNLLGHTTAGQAGGRNADGRRITDANYAGADPPLVASATQPAPPSR